ncbi:hypothetical protein PAPYR_9193 [Paratrimastix pyriformis]|uniref:PSI domain-containing protein n=1 Tax=Paratrimastix pyriformis TaxID=342808 RepID=A0ABQ8UBN2_9EUKA|nr:hypothetical protein PAPYR_9193 [Paratrimastix pyriformis]
MPTPKDCTKFTTCRSCFDGASNCYWCGPATATEAGSCMLGNDTMPLVGTCPHSQYYSSFHMCGATTGELWTALVLSILVAVGTTVLGIYHFLKLKKEKAGYQTLGSQ